MKGLPKWFNTKKDFLHCLADPALKDGAQAKLRELLEARMTWLNKGELESGSAGVEDATHRVVEQEVRSADGKTVSRQYLQFALEEDPGARLFVLGFTVEEAEKLLQE